jgi:hypothetical protein
MREKQCQSVAKTTRTQCEKRALLGGSYCWFHTPKKEPFIFLVIGALLGFGIQTIYDKVAISPEESLITDLQAQIQNYQESIEQKDQRISELEDTTNSILEYSEVARLDALGNPPGLGPGSDISINNELTKLLKDTYVFKDGQIRMSRSAESESKYRQLIQKYPKFPFGYYFVALCLRDNRNEEWRSYAIKAVEILEQTVKLDGHNKNHDEVLARLNRWLGDNRERN